MEHSISIHDTALTRTHSDPTLELTNYPEGRNLPQKDGGADGPHKNATPFQSPAHEILFVGVVCVAQLTTQISLGQTLNLVHIIGDHFHTTNPGTLSWFVAGYSLTVGSFILLFGRFGDYFGYKRLFIVGLCWFSLWSTVAGLSTFSNDILFIFARVFQGKFSTSLGCVNFSRVGRHWSSHVSSQCCCYSRRHLSSRAAEEPYIRCIWRRCPRRRGDWSCLWRHLPEKLAMGVL